MNNPLPSSVVKSLLHVYSGGAWTAWDGAVTASASDTDPLILYKASDLDTDADTKYYGFLAPDGSWYIMEEVTTSETFRFVKGASNYSQGWSARASQTYGYFDSVF